MAEPQKVYGATLGDLGIAVVDFARAEPFKFSFLVMILCIGAGLLLAVYRGVTSYLKRDYEDNVLKQRHGGNEGD